MQTLDSSIDILPAGGRKADVLWSARVSGTRLLTLVAPEGRATAAGNRLHRAGASS